MHDGYYYSFWSDGTSGTATMTLRADGGYSTNWTNIGNFTAGKGWAIGRQDQVVRYSGSFDGGSNGFLALYGWTKDPLIEYYVVENHGKWMPPGGQALGEFESDGGTYKIYKTQRINQPSIKGRASFYQYWSVRTSKRSKGIIHFMNHVAAWQSHGMTLGETMDYQIMETEGYHSSGQSAIDVQSAN